MAAVSGLGTTFTLPNFVGELFQITPRETPFLSMAGGLQGGRSVSSKQFTWQTVDNNDAAQPNGIVEGADPDYEERDRAEVSNVVQIFQYGVKVSYTKEAATGQLGPSATSILGNQPVQNEVAFQLDLKIARAARDVDYTFLNGTYQNPANNSTGRKSRGIITAVTTNTVAAGSADLSKARLDELLLEMYNSGAPMRDTVIFCNGYQKQKVSDVWGYAPESRTVGGLNIQTIETDFGALGVVLDRQMPTDTILVADMSVVKPAFLAIPDKGHFFVEPMAKTGAYDAFQLYGEIGLEYGPERWHGTITGLADGS